MKITVVIVTYNAEPWINKCFGSLRKNSINIDVIVIDNASTDNTVAILKSEFREFELIESKTNLGFGKANNIGIARAYHSGSDFVFLLNQDAWVEYDTIQKITDLHINNSDYGIISPVHLADNGLVVDKTFLTYITEKNNNKMIADIIVGKSIKPLYNFRFVNAAIWSLSRKCIEQVGGFDEIFSHYGEDADYCNRVLSRDLKIGVAPMIKAIHNRSQDDKRVTIDITQKMYISYLLHFKIINKSGFKLLTIHLFKVAKVFLVNSIKFNFMDSLIVFKANMKLINQITEIRRSRDKQKNKFAFLNSNGDVMSKVKYK